VADEAVLDAITVAAGRLPGTPRRGLLPSCDSSEPGALILLRATAGRAIPEPGVATEWQVTPARSPCTGEQVGPVLAPVDIIDRGQNG